AANASFEISSDGNTWMAANASVTCDDGICLADWNAAALAVGHYFVRGRAGSAVSDSRGVFVAAAAPLPSPAGAAAVVSARGVAIHWTAVIAPAPAAYTVLKLTGNDWQVIGRVASTDFVDTDLVAAGTASYRVESVDSDGAEGTPTATVTVTKHVSHANGSVNASQLTAPTGLVAVSSVGGVVLRWSQATGADAYTVQRSFGHDAPFVDIGTSAATRFVDPAGPVGGQAYYRVVANATGGNSSPSLMVSALLIPPAPTSSPALVVAGTATTTPTAGGLSLSTSTASTASVLAGTALHVAATGNSTSRVSAARIEVKSGASAWQPVATLPVGSTSTGWTSLGSIATSTLSAGTYSIRAVALAPSGSVLETTAAALVRITHSAPAPLAVQSQVTGDTVGVSWTAAAASLPVTYSVYRSDPTTSGYVLAASGLTGTSFQDAHLPGASAVSYVVTASDQVGNQSAFSMPSSITTPAAWNLHGPSVTLPMLNDAGGTSVVSADASARNGLASVMFAFAPVGSGSWIDLPAPLPLPTALGGSSFGQQLSITWAALWNTSGLQGSYDIKVIVADLLGNVAEQIQNVTFSASAPRGPPSVALTASNIAGGVRLTWPTAGTTYQVRRSATGGTGTFNPIGATQASTYDDLTALSGVSYFYQLWTASAPSSQIASIAVPVTLGHAIVTGSGGGTAISPSGAATVTLAPGSVAGNVAL
ncbi:MAG TPA: hypothetical protein VEQ67_08325, partial [Mycobacterium sp.]|nr:hypothetical protein [Mycobacterium sp.]